MPVFKTSRRVSVPPDIAYAVAADVASYKDFLPLLERSSLRGAVIEDGDINRFNAELAVGYAKLNLREAFVSQVTCDSGKRTVTATSQDAPFRDMKTVWSIRDVNGQSDVTISIDYAMRSMLLQFAVSGAMDMAVNKIMTAFEARALAVQRASKTI
jgi:coenzyme Q-binding protein COQ10